MQNIDFKPQDSDKSDQENEAEEPRKVKPLSLLVHFDSPKEKQKCIKALLCKRMTLRLMLWMRSTKNQEDLKK